MVKVDATVEKDGLLNPTGSRNLSKFYIDIDWICLIDWDKVICSYFIPKDWHWIRLSFARQSNGRLCR